tara:strand:- start:1108 stop:1479 length:372 start_codon:yes stop_codon:yes gene_type:complete
MKKNNIFTYQINKLELFGYHGVFDDEKNNGQIFILNITYSIKYNDGILTNDNIRDVIDYIDVVKEVDKIFNSKRYNLIESLLEDLYSMLDKKFKFYKLNIDISKKRKLYSKKMKKIKVKIENE